VAVAGGVNFRIRGIPPFRQKKGERMGHGVGTKTSCQSPEDLAAQKVFGLLDDYVAAYVGDGIG
jgi:hypothetical protein